MGFEKIPFPSQLTTVRRLLSEKATHVNTRDEDEYTPLHRAAYSGHLDVVRELIAQGADVHAVTVDGWTPLHSACKWNNTRVASYSSMTQILTPRQKASWRPYISLPGTGTAKIPWSFSWWTATSNQVWRTTWKKLPLILPGEQVSITTSLKLWKAAQILHLSHNGSNNFLKFPSTSASFVWDRKYPHDTKLTSKVLR